MAPLWTPSPDRIARANLTRFIAQARLRRELPRAVAGGSVDCLGEFWPAVWGLLRNPGDQGECRPDPGWGRWLRPLTLSRNLPRTDVHVRPTRPRRRVLGGSILVPRRAAQLRRQSPSPWDDREALVFWNETGRQRALTYAGAAATRSQAGARHWCGAGSGGGPGRWPDAEHARDGDRHARGHQPRRDLVRLLAGLRRRAVLDRFGQIQPKVLIATDGYRYAGKLIDLTERTGRIPRRASLGAINCHRAVPGAAGLGGWPNESPITAESLCRMAGGMARRRRATLPPSRWAVGRCSSSSAGLHPVLLGYHRTAEGHRPWCRRDVAPACRRNRSCIPICRGTIASSTSPPAAG